VRWLALTWAISGGVDGGVTGACSTTLGCAGGSESKTLVTANLPPYTPESVSVLSTVSDIVRYPNYTGYWRRFAGGAPGSGGWLNTNRHSSAAAHFYRHFGRCRRAARAPLRTIQPTMLATIYVKIVRFIPSNYVQLCGIPKE
jgi:hypothetical protein